MAEFGDLILTLIIKIYHTQSSLKCPSFMEAGKVQITPGTSINQDRDKFGIRCDNFR